MLIFVMQHPTLMCGIKAESFFCSQNAAADSEAKNAELNRAVEELNKLLKETMEGLNNSL